MKPLVICLFLSLLVPTRQAHAEEGVILLHGLGRSSRSMSRMESRLKQAGFRVHNVNYPSRSAPIEDLADEAIIMIGIAPLNPAGSACAAATRLNGCAR